MKKLVHGYLHTHWDMEWYRDKEDFDIRLVEVFDTVIDELVHKKAPYFYFDGQVVALLNYLKIRPEKEQIIKRLIKEKKLAIGPFFVSADTYLTSFMSMMKNLEFGLKYSKEFNQKEFIGYICDVFGVSNSIFEVLKLNNIDKSIIWRGVNPKKIGNNCNFIKNDIKTLWLAQGYFNDYLNVDDINISALKKHIDKIAKYSKDAILLPIGADHLGVLKDANKKIEKLNKQLEEYKIVLTNPFEYFKNSKFENITKEVEFLDNSDTYILGGVYSARIPQKVKNSHLQNEISRVVEPLNFYLKENYQKNIDFAYREIIQNHAHDGIYGCSLDSVKNAVDYRFEKCSNILNSIKKNIVYHIKKKNNLSKSENKIGFINLSNKDNINTIELTLPYILKNSQVLDCIEKFKDDDLANIYKIPVTEEIVKHYRQLVEISDNKKFEFNTVEIKKPEKLTRVTLKSIENNYIKLEIKNKKIKIFDKNKEKSITFKLTDIKDEGDSYNFAPKGEYKELDLLKTKIISNGDIQSSLRLYFKGVELDVILNNHSKYFNFRANINNKTKNHKLQFVIETDKNIQTTICQDALATVKRNHDYSYKMQDFMPVERPFELKTNSYPMQGFVIANGVCCLTKGLNEYEIFNNELRICLLRAFGTISNPKNPARAIPAGPNLATPDAQLIRKYSVEFAISFNLENEIYKDLDEFYKNYLTVDGEYNKNLSFRLFELEKDEIFYGIFNNKKVVYNLKTKKVYLK